MGRAIWALIMFAVYVAEPGLLVAEESRESAVADPRSSSEARGRAKLLHEMSRGMLQVMHRDFFDEDNAHAIPSASMEDVFQALESSYRVKLKWLVVNTDVVNVDHQPADDFERSAAKQLARGRPFVEQIGEEQYRYAGPIRLKSQCLKCHVKRRTSNQERTAGLVISMPLKLPPR